MITVESPTKKKCVVALWREQTYLHEEIGMYLREFQNELSSVNLISKFIHHNKIGKFIDYN